MKLEPNRTGSYPGWYGFNIQGLLIRSGLVHKIHIFFLILESMKIQVFNYTHMIGWHYDKEDGRWYYLDLETGSMARLEKYRGKMVLLYRT